MDEKQKKLKILYIEDDHTLATLYMTRMQAEGYDVRHFPDGESALQVAREYHPDLVIVDLMMPSLSGYDVLDNLRSIVELGGTKFVVMSALSQPEDVEKAKSLGADDFIVKSQTTIDDVMERIRALVPVR